MNYSELLQLAKGWGNFKFYRVIIWRLQSMGFVITDDGKHYKWTYFGDHRYSATMAKTSSDNRAGMNMASLIDNLML